MNGVIVNNNVVETGEITGSLKGLTTNSSKIYRIGNLAILDVYIRKNDSSGIPKSSWTKVHDVPYIPMATTYASAPVGTASGGTMDTVSIRVTTAGEVQVYAGGYACKQNIRAVVVYPIRE